MASDCSSYYEVGKTDFILSWVLVVGIYISFVPQHVRVIRRRTSEGLSPSYLLMGSISAFASFVNMYLVTVPARHCCTVDLNAYQCANAMTGYIQMIYRYYLFFVIYVIVNFIACICVVHAPGQQHGRNAYADVSGVVSLILQVVQYLPQLWTTYRIREPGTLSIPSLVIQVPGTFYWAYSLYDEADSKWSSYLPFFAAASLQGILLLMCIFYRWRMHVRKSRQLTLQSSDQDSVDDAADTDGSVIASNSSSRTADPEQGVLSHRNSQAAVSENGRTSLHREDRDGSQDVSDMQIPALSAAHVNSIVSRAGSIISETVPAVHSAQNRASDVGKAVDASIDAHSLVSNGISVVASRSPSIIADKANTTENAFPLSATRSTFDLQTAINMETPQRSLDATSLHK
ncbi:hypothetical protein BRETT_001793 [Brettanomyces bruxellensis]|uniref:Uncharacterized protein n=1 Tax=Dekkera bruxellensis TaxID=5007 RepID=A0A871R3F2_DEKBR|nr:uncharacterized protein BRETT_001793 [Brettanomyces bruxellensis]QOU18725.1 hypothetical protein BRETT_001793 [Brettanomyces bruxellensis]